MDQFPNLEPILALQHFITVTPGDRTLQLLSVRNEIPHLIAQQRFSRNEWRVVVPVLRAYPGYAAYAELVAELTGISRSLVEPRLQEARRSRTLSQELRAVRDAISHADQKLAAFRLTLAPIHEHGYTLALLQANP